MTDDGRLTDVESKIGKTATLNTASCVCISTTVQPKEIKTLEFALTWHMPEIKFGLGQKKYFRFVISFFIKRNILFFVFVKMVYKMV